jgi:hypothetical protein
VAPSPAHECLDDRRQGATALGEVVGRLASRPVACPAADDLRVGKLSKAVAEQWLSPASPTADE